MKTTFVNAAFAIALILFGHSSMAQFDDDTGAINPIDPFENEGWGLVLNQYNVWESGVFFDQISDFYFDNDEEELEEITVRAKRLASSRMYLGELFAIVDWILVDDIMHNQQSECQMMAAIDPGTVCFVDPQPLAGCVTTTLTVPGLSQSDADELNLAYSALQNVESAANSLTVGGITAILSGGMTTGGTLLSLVATGGTFIASLPDIDNINPFSAGDSFEITMTTCGSTDGFSEPRTSVSVEYTSG